MPENKSPDDVDTLANLVMRWLVAEQDAKAAEAARARAVAAITDWTRANPDELHPMS